MVDRERAVHRPLQHEIAIVQDRGMPQVHGRVVGG